MNTQVTNYIQKAPPGHREILEQLREIIHCTLKEVDEEYKWSRPVFSKGGREFAYIRDASKHVAIGFYDATNLNDPQGFLEGSGKTMKHTKIRKVENLNKEIVVSWLKQLF